MARMKRQKFRVNRAHSKARKDTIESEQMSLPQLGGGRASTQCRLRAETQNSKLELPDMIVGIQRQEEIPRSLRSHPIKALLLGSSPQTTSLPISS
jgi:hypothetical protein